jgi:hypothetical protein
MGVLGSIALRLSIEVKREGGKETTYDLADVWCDLSGSELHCRHAPPPKTFGC